jgi:hypothetical protein
LSFIVLVFGLLAAGLLNNIWLAAGVIVVSHAMQSLKMAWLHHHLHNCPDEKVDYEREDR